MLDYVKASIRTQMADWTETPVKWPNENIEITADTPWLAIEIDGGQGYTSPFGDTAHRFSRNAGILWLMIYVPTGTGFDDASTLLRQASALFAMQSLATSVSGCYLHFDAASFGGSGSGDEDGLWYMEALSIPFTLVTSE